VAGESPSPLLEDVLILEEGAFELRPADRRDDIREERVVAPGPPAPGPPDATEGTSPLDGGETVRTVTMASVYWDQGKQEEARRIIEGILRGNPLDPRALAWQEARGGKRPGKRGKEVENALTGFLEKVAKEYGYDVPRHH